MTPGWTTDQRKADFWDSQADWETEWSSLTNQVCPSKLITGQCFRALQYLMHTANMHTALENLTQLLKTRAPRTLGSTPSIENTAGRGCTHLLCNQLPW